jgi:hypothetical protein
MFMKPCGCSALGTATGKVEISKLISSRKFAECSTGQLNDPPVSDHMYRVKNQIPFKEYLVL